MDIHSPAAAVEIPAPDTFQNQIARHDDAALARQEEQQLVFLGLHGQGGVVPAHLMARLVNDQIAKRNLLSRRRNIQRGQFLADQPLAAQHSLDAGHQLAHAERLGHVVVRPDLQTDDLVDLVCFGRQHQDRHVHLLAQHAAHLDPVHAGEHQVQDQQIGLLAAGGSNAFLAVADRDHFVPLACQIVSEGFLKSRLVLDHQHLVSHMSSFLQPVKRRPRNGYRACTVSSAGLQ